MLAPSLLLVSFKKSESLFEQTSVSSTDPAPDSVGVSVGSADVRQSSISHSLKVQLNAEATKEKHCLFRDTHRVVVAVNNYECCTG